MHVIPVQFATPEYDQTVELRRQILRIPLDLEFYPEDFEKEYLDTHLACYNDQNELLGCLVMTPKIEGQIKMRQVAVAEQHQGKGVGRLLVEASERYASHEGYKEIVLNAREVALKFYLSLAYEKQGKPFTEVTIKHYKMRKLLS